MFPLPQGHGTSSGYGWRRQPPDMVNSYEYIKLAVSDRRQGMVLKLGGWGTVICLFSVTKF